MSFLNQWCALSNILNTYLYGRKWNRKKKTTNHMKNLSHSWFWVIALIKLVWNSHENRLGGLKIAFHFWFCWFCRSLLNNMWISDWLSEWMSDWVNMLLGRACDQSNGVFFCLNTPLPKNAVKAKMLHWRRNEWSRRYTTNNFLFLFQMIFVPS